MYYIVYMPCFPFRKPIKTVDIPQQKKSKISPRKFARRPKRADTICEPRRKFSS